MKNQIFKVLGGIFIFLSAPILLAQADSDHDYKPLTLKLNESGSKYIRFINWHQLQVLDSDLKKTNKNNSNPGFRFRLRRSRFLTYAQISDRFLILTHFGLNSLASSNADPIGNRSDSPQLFMHAAWGEFRVGGDWLYIGSGLHYWNGLSRFTSSSTLNFTALDNHRGAWAQLGLTNQFARHLGVYFKGFLWRFRYTLAANDPIVNTLDNNKIDFITDGKRDPAKINDIEENTIAYLGVRDPESGAGLVTAGYIDLQILDKESNKLPYRVGSYLGKKKVLNVGAGFFNHNAGTIRIERAANGQKFIKPYNVNHWAADIYLDLPLGRGALNFYTSYINYNYGPKYNLGSTYGTGDSIYAQLGYLLPFTMGERQRLMPYVAYTNKNFEVFSNQGHEIRGGLNWYINGHHAKITLEYQDIKPPSDDENQGHTEGLTLQAHLFL
jgi:hypothetical protein